MSKALLTVVVLAALVAGGWLWYEGKLPMLGAPAQEEQAPSVSFMCDDTSRFIAEFPASGTVQIFVDGTMSAEVPRVEGAGQRFENDAMVYVFAGEEVSVTNKATGSTTACSQPFDANNAPYNFGDAGEGGGVQQDSALIVSESIVGTWRSNEDAKFDRVFMVEGKIEDRYEGEVVATGTWKAYTSADAVAGISFPLEANTVYVQAVMSGTEAETLNFKVAKLTPESLELIYLDRGNMLSFTFVE